jgi:hypothetical protein
MFKKNTAVLLAILALAGCATDKPHVVQASTSMEELRLTGGMATQVEMPDGERVKSVVTGNPGLVDAQRDDNVVNLIPKETSGETNLIVRTVDGDGNAKVYQYRVVVQGSR